MSLDTKSEIIKKVRANNRKKAFEVETARGFFHFPYSKLELEPTQDNKIVKLYVDPELAKTAFTYILESGAEDSIVADQIFEYNKEPRYMNDVMLYRLSNQAQDLVKKSKLSKREIIRRMGTSPTQFYRLIDQTNYHKTIDQMLKLLHALDCTVEFTIKKAA